MSIVFLWHRCIRQTSSHFTNATITMIKGLGLKSCLSLSLCLSCFSSALYSLQYRTHHSSCWIKCRVHCPHLLPKPSSAEMRKKQEKDKYVCGGKRTGRIRKKNGEEKKRTNERGASLKKKKWEINAGTLWRCMIIWFMDHRRITNRATVLAQCLAPGKQKCFRVKPDISK